jgi:hypothetical protein
MKLNKPVLNTTFPVVPKIPYPLLDFSQNYKMKKDIAHNGELDSSAGISRDFSEMLAEANGEHSLQLDYESMVHEWLILNKIIDTKFYHSSVYLFTRRSLNFQLLRCGAQTNKYGTVI